MENYDQIIEDLKKTPISKNAIKSYIEYSRLRIQRSAQTGSNVKDKVQQIREIISEVENQIIGIRSEILSDEIKGYIEECIYNIFNELLRANEYNDDGRC